MEGESKKVLFNIEIKTEDANKRIAELNIAERKLMDTNRELAKSYTQNAVQIAKNNAELREIRKSKQGIINLTDQENKQNRAQAGSIAAARAELARLKSEYINLANPTKEQTKRLKDLTDQLKEQEEAIGITSRSVGNYKEAFKEAAGGMQFMGKSVKDVGLAVKANPIGFLITALISLVEVLRQSKPFMEFFETSLAQINGILDVLKDRVTIAAEAFKQLLSGEYTKAAETFSKATKGITDEIVNEVKAVGDLTKARRELQREEAKSLAFSKQNIAEQERLKNIRDDEFNSIQQRIAANNQARKLEEERLQKLEGFAKRNLELTKQEVERRRTVGELTQEQLEKLGEAENRLAEIREESAGRQNEFITENFSLQQDLNEKLKVQMEQQAKDVADTTSKAITDSIKALQRGEEELQDMALRAQESFAKESESRLQKSLIDQAKAGIKAREKGDAEELARQQRQAAAEVNIQQAKYQTLNNINSAISSLGDILMREGKEAAAFQKGLALFQIAANTAIAISELMKASEGNPLNLLTGGIAGIAQFTGGIARIFANVAQAKKLLSETPEPSASFYEGGEWYGYTGSGNARSESRDLGRKPYTYHRRELIVNHQTLETPEGAALGNRLTQLMQKGGAKVKTLPGFYDGGYAIRAATAGVDQQLGIAQTGADLTKVAMQEVNIELNISELEKKQKGMKQVRSKASLKKG